MLRPHLPTVLLIPRSPVRASLVKQMLAPIILEQLHPFLSPVVSPLILVGECWEALFRSIPHQCLGFHP